MKISFNWLKNHLPLDISAEETAVLLTDCGLEVESVEKHESVKGGLAGCVIGEVKSKEKHPDADRLNLTTVDTGTGTLLNIVCGAANVAVGQKVVVATVGSTIYPSKGEPITLKKVKIRGAVSEGMICAEDELGLGESHEGIMVLSPDAKIGSSAKGYFKVEEDYTIEIGLTPNRGDAASHRGVARDLFTVLNWTLQENKYSLNIPSVAQLKVGNKTGSIQVTVEDAEACPRYSGVSITGITVKESPDWLKKRLLSIGLKPINNIVDATNFILHDLGQPLHAFDADKIAGNHVIVKKLKEGTKFISLDGVERKLSAEDLMICSAEEPMCIAGVFGGLHSGVSGVTKNIFLESAYFSSVTIRRSSKHHLLKTDASFRFERGTDPTITTYTLMRAALLIQEIAGGTLAPEMIDIYPNIIENKKVTFSFYNCNRLIGQEINRNKIKRILELLDINIITEGGETLLLSIPTCKSDISIEEDIIEEILRVYGCNNIEIPTAVHSSLSYISKPDTEKIRNTISDQLCASGFTEIMSNSLTNSKYTALVQTDTANTVELLNPLSPELNVLRTTLLFSGLEAIAYNQNRKNTDLKLFEFGKIYQKSSSNGFFEENHLALFLYGSASAERWSGKQEPVNFYLLKAFVDNILERLAVNVSQISEMSSDFFSSGLSYHVKKKKVVEFGFVKKQLSKSLDVKQEVFYADFNWDAVVELTKDSKIKYKEISKFPDVRRDLALVVDKNIKYDQLEKLAFQSEKNLLKKVNLFDVYEGDKIEQGKKSYALSFIIQNNNATLTDSEVDKVIQKLIKVYQDQAGAVIRS